MTDTANAPANDPVTDEELASLFRRASRMMARAYHRHEHAHHAQSHVLAIIGERGPINQRDLLEMLDVRSSSLSEILGKLERSDLIARERNENDRRSFVVSATKQGRAFHDRQESARQGNAFHPFDDLDGEERARLSNILEKIIASLMTEPLCLETRGERGRGRRFQAEGRGIRQGRGRGGRGSRGGRKGD